MFFEKQKGISRKYKFAIIIAISISEFIINQNYNWTLKSQINHNTILLYNKDQLKIYKMVFAKQVSEF